MNKWLSIIRRKLLSSLQLMLTFRIYVFTHFPIYILYYQLSKELYIKSEIGYFSMNASGSLLIELLGTNRYFMSLLFKPLVSLPIKATTMIPY